MTVTKITATKETIVLTLDAAVRGAAAVTARVPLVCGDKAKKAAFEDGRAVAQHSCTLQDSAEIVLPRFEGAYDLLTCRFALMVDGSAVPGVCYVTDFSDDFAVINTPYPAVERPIGTWCNALEEDVGGMRFGYMMNELDMIWLLKRQPEDGDHVHVFNGEEYYFDKEIIAENDRMMAPLAAKGIPCLIRFINRVKYRLRKADRVLFDMIKHPDYEDDFEGVEMSAINLRTETGFRYYCACIDFLFSRYCDPANGFGWNLMMDVGNEINSARIWNNAGPMCCEDYIEEYTEALRLAWQLSHKYYAHYRVNVSLEQYFADSFIQDGRYYYPARDCLENILKYCRRDGDFDWGVAAHPYPENLNYPDFYNDRGVSFDFDTRKITLKNMEVWPALLSSSAFLYRGQPRHVIFDEQGFNTRADAPYTEEQGAYAFVLAWLKMRKQPAIDLLLIHRYIDIPFNEEYGLNLGLRRCYGYADEEHLITIPGPHKMICRAIAAMDSPEEDAWVRAARAYIGPDLFDDVLNPPAVTEGRTTRYITNFEI